MAPSMATASLAAAPSLPAASLAAALAASNVLIGSQPHIDSNSSASVDSWSNATTFLTSARHTDSIDAQSRHFDANLSNTFTPPAMSKVIANTFDPHTRSLLGDHVPSGR